MRHRQVRNRRNCLRRDDRGASLIAVIVALVFVITIGTIVMEITTTNIRMSGIELSTKKNFYSAESVMEELKSKLAEKAAELLKDVTGVLSVSSGDVPTLQAEFKRQYMEKLEQYFSGVIHTPPAAPASESFFVGKYLEDPVKGVLIGSSSADYLKFPADPDEWIFSIDYERGIFTLKNILVIFDDGIYKTSISTDLVFSAPEFLSGGVTGGDMFPVDARIGDYLTYENWTKNEE